MMMPKKKKKVLIITSIILVLLIIIGVIIALYLTTDMFKSGQVLFQKYISKGVENAGNLSNGITKNDYEELLEQSPYTSKTNITIDCTENINTDLENANPINKLELQVEGTTDRANDYNYQDITLLNDDKEMAKVKYLQNGNVYGIHFSDIFNQYVLVNGNDLQYVLESAGVSKEQLDQLPENLDFSFDLGNVFNFSNEEIQTLKNRYINIILENSSKENFSKQSKQKIKVDAKEFNANAYTLTLTKEKINNIYLKILEEVKKDEIILSKIDNLEAILKQYQINVKLKNTFVEEIDELSTQISQSNIGQDKCTATVYESEEIPIKVVLKGTNYEIEIDLINSQEKDFIRIYNKNLANQNEKLLVFRNDSEGKYTNIRTTENGKTKDYVLKISEVVNGDICDRTINAEFGDGVNKVTANIQQNMELIEEIKDKVSTGNENTINLSGLEPEQVKNVLNTVTTQVSEKMKGITDVVSSNDLRRVLEVIGVLKERTTIQSQGITETEKNRFNSQFTILEGENLDSVAILNLINAIKGNLINLEVVSNQQIRLRLDRLNNDEQMATTFTEYVNKNKNEKYNAKVEYDETGLARDILLTLVEKK